VDLVILNERAPSYVQDLPLLLESLVRMSQSAGRHEGDEPHGSVYIVRADRVAAAQRDVLLAVARAVVSSRRGSLAEQLTRAQRPDPEVVVMPRRRETAAVTPVAVPPEPLELFNGLGGFAADGAGYVTSIGARRWTPTPGPNAIPTEGSGF